VSAKTAASPFSCGISRGITSQMSSQSALTRRASAARDIRHQLGDRGTIHVHVRILAHSDCEPVMWTGE